MSTSCKDRVGSGGDSLKIRPYREFGNLVNDVMAYLEGNEVRRLKEFFFYYLASMGCHVLNIYNRTRRIVYTRFGAIPDLRLHIFFVGPPGSGKSFYCDLLFDTSFGVAWDEGFHGFPNFEEGYLNLASLIGTVTGKDEEGEPIKEPGDADKFDKHIIWAEEFTGIREVMRTDYSAGFADAFLKLTDNGKVERSMRFGRIEYQSYCTLWLGTQTERMDLPSGLSRRFLFLDLNMDRETMDDLRDAWHKGRGKKPDQRKLASFRAGFKGLFESPFNLRRITFDPGYITFLKSLKTPHINLDLLERLAIGWNWVRRGSQDMTELIVRTDPLLEDMIHRALGMRYKILGMQQYNAIFRLLVGRGWVRQTGFCQECTDISVNYADARERVDKMVKMGIIEREKRAVKGAKKKVWFIQAVEGVGDVGDYD